jgi:hypothetical protein
MGAYLLLGIVLLVVALLGARSFVQANPAQMAQAVRAFIAAFSALASTGLLFTGRFGLALITIGATVMAIRAMRRAPGGLGGGARGHSERGPSSEVVTDTLRMELEHEGAPVSVTLIKPGFIDTAFVLHSKHYLPVKPRYGVPVYAPEIVADAVLHAAEHPVRDLIVGGSVVVVIHHSGRRGLYLVGDADEACAGEVITTSAPSGAQAAPIRSSP